MYIVHPATASIHSERLLKKYNDGFKANRPWLKGIPANDPA
jgi:hypothetical protein